MKITAIVFTMTFSTLVFGQQSTYYTDQWGRPAGQAWTFGNQTFYSDLVGKPTGSAASNGPLPPPPIALPYPKSELLGIEAIRPTEPIRLIGPSFK